MYAAAFWLQLVAVDVLMVTGCAFGVLGVLDGANADLDVRWAVWLRGRALVRAWWILNFLLVVSTSYSYSIYSYSYYYNIVLTFPGEEGVWLAKMGGGAPGNHCMSRLMLMVTLASSFTVALSAVGSAWTFLGEIKRPLFKVDNVRDLFFGYRGGREAVFEFFRRQPEPEIQKVPPACPHPLDPRAEDVCPICRDDLASVELSLLVKQSDDQVHAHIAPRQLSKCAFCGSVAHTACVMSMLMMSGERGGNPCAVCRAF